MEVGLWEGKTLNMEAKEGKNREHSSSFVRQSDMNHLVLTRGTNQQHTLGQLAPQ